MAFASSYGNVVPSSLFFFNLKKTRKLVAFCIFGSQEKYYSCTCSCKSVRGQDRNIVENLAASSCGWCFLV